METNWLQVGKGLRQSCIPFPYLFQLYGEHILRKYGLEEDEIGRRNNINLYYTDDTTLIVEKANDLQILITQLKNHSGKNGTGFKDKNIKLLTIGTVVNSLCF